MPTAVETTRTIARRWDRRARRYDVLIAPMERMLRFAPARASLVARAAGGRVLEVGAGTGRNLDHYDAATALVLTDLSAGMLARAAEKARHAPATVRLVVSDAEHLPFRDGAFDRVVATFVFCSVPDPVAALGEVRRVLRPDGEAVLLEHMRPRGLLGRLFDLLDPLVSRLSGPHINRRTVDNIGAAGLKIAEARAVTFDWIKVLVARKERRP